MDELQLIGNFRSGLPPASDDVRKRARELLAAQYGRRRVFGLPAVGRRHVLVWVAAALLAGLLAGSAFAFGDRILDFVRGQPATKPVKHQFKFDFGPRPSAFRSDPGVIMSRVHGVLAFKTQKGPLALWIAPTREGGLCYLFRSVRPKTPSERVGASAGCFFPGYLGKRPLTAQIDGISPAFAWGWASKKIARVEVHLADDSLHHNAIRRATVYEHFFAVSVLGGSTLAYAVGFDAKGRKVATYRELPPAKLNPRPPARVGPFRRIFNTKSRVGGITHRVVLDAAPAARGGICVHLSYTAPQQEPSTNATRYCQRRSKRAIELLGIGEVGPPMWGFLIGRAKAGVASVALRFEDRTAIPLRLTPGRFFLVFVSGRRTAPGHQAVALVARDRAGRVLGTKSLAFSGMP